MLLYLERALVGPELHTAGRDLLEPVGNTFDVPWSNVGAENLFGRMNEEDGREVLGQVQLLGHVCRLGCGRPSKPVVGQGVCVELLQHVESFFFFVVGYDRNNTISVSAALLLERFIACKLHHCAIGQR